MSTRVGEWPDFVFLATVSTPNADARFDQYDAGLNCLGYCLGYCSNVYMGLCMSAFET